MLLGRQIFFFLKAGEQKIKQHSPKFKSTSPHSYLHDKKVIVFCTYKSNLPLNVQTEQTARSSEKKRIARTKTSKPNKPSSWNLSTCNTVHCCLKNSSLSFSLKNIVVSPRCLEAATGSCNWHFRANTTSIKGRLYFPWINSLNHFQDWYGQDLFSD